MADGPRPEGNERPPIDPGFIIQAGVLGTLSLLFVAAFLIALKYEPKQRLTGRETKSGLDWWCRRIGLVQSLVCLAWSVDMRSKPIYPLPAP